MPAKALDAPYEKPAIAARAGSRSSGFIRWTWSCSAPSGAMAGAPASSPICTWEPLIRPRANTSCSARPHKGLTDAMLACAQTPGISRARNSPRSGNRVHPSGTGGGNRLQRFTSEQPLSPGAGAAAHCGSSAIGDFDKVCARQRRHDGRYTQDLRRSSEPRAALKLGARPNRHCRRIPGGKTGVIGLILRGRPANSRQFVDAAAAHTRFAFNIAQWSDTWSSSCLRACSERASPRGGCAKSAATSRCPRGSRFGVAAPTTQEKSCVETAAAPGGVIQWLKNASLSTSEAPALRAAQFRASVSRPVEIR